MRGMGVGSFNVTLKHANGTEVLDMPAVRAITLLIPEEAYAQSLALTCGEHWRSDPDHGPVYVVMFQYPKAVDPNATGKDT